jgi:hypothetical protein
MSEVEFELVIAPQTKKGYYLRRIPYTRKTPTRGQLAHQAAFAKAAMSARDQEGYVVVDGEILPPAAAAVKEQTSGSMVESPTIALPEEVIRGVIKAVEQKHIQGPIVISNVSLKRLAKAQARKEKELETEVTQ